MNRSRSVTLAALLLATSAALLLGGCPELVDILNPPAKPLTANQLRPFDSASEMLSFFRNQATQRNRRSGGLFGGFLAAAPTSAEDGAGAANDSAAGASGEFSTTNLQELGVDESDVFKSDGTYFYIADDQAVHVVQAAPTDQLGEVSQVVFDEYVTALYLYNDRLIVLAESYDAGASPGEPFPLRSLVWPPYWGGGNVVVYAVDISTPSTPTIVERIALDGPLADSRLTGGQLHLVLTIVPELPDNASTIALATLTLEDVLPRATIDGVESPLLSWEDYYRPDEADGYYTTAVVTLNADNVEQIAGRVAVMGRADTIYATQDTLYISDATYAPDGDYRETTSLHKFAFVAGGAAQYIGSGVVPGRLLNQFSLGEHAGYLRVATHVNNLNLFFGGPVLLENDIAVATTTAADPNAVDPNNADPNADAPVVFEPEQPYHAVFVLGEDAGELKVVGSLQNIAPGEDLYAARFNGERGYLVTFEQIDPLFVLNLANPTQPTILGELKIPGYSDYLHPFGEDLLIGLGRSTATTEWGGTVPKALQLSLFDVSDPNNPTVIEQLEVGGYGSVSDVSSTHKAFTFLPSSGRLAIPAWVSDANTSLYDYDQAAFEGVLVYEVTADGFTVLGQLPVARDTGYPWTAYDNWRRGAFIGDDVYAITPTGVQTAPLSDFDATRSITLTAAP